VAKPRDTSTRTLRVLFVAAEADPIIKVGGLGDVTGSLPRSLRALKPADAMGYNLDVRLVIPFHGQIKEKIPAGEPEVTFTVPHPEQPVLAQAYRTHVDDLPVYMIAGEPIPENAPVYSLDTQKDGKKFTFFSLAVLELARALNWPPDILHANDWHTALSTYALKYIYAQDPFFANTRSILTVHNLPFMGAGTDEALIDYGIPELKDDRLPPWGSYQPLPMGLASADYLSTVSPTYAQEIMTADFGCGLQDFLKMRSDSVTGILNGLDESSWDPQTDTALKANFGLDTIEKRFSNKRHLIQEVGLPPNLDLPLLILISRMDYQKGVDLAIEGLRLISGVPWQAVLLGTGDPALETAARQLETEFPYRVKSVIRFDAKFARRMYAGGDMLMMPSRYEPCGLAQMIAMRYGCIPVARATGGLSDSIIEGKNPETSTGFLFQEAESESLAGALRRALTAYADRDGWKARQKFGMQQNFSWQRSAQDYAHIYKRLVEPNSAK
jgi:starch synthase